MTDYTVIGKFRNKENVKVLVEGIRARGKTCYDFTEKPADPDNASGSGDEQMRVFESDSNFLDSEYLKQIFEADLAGLKNAENVILLLPAGTSAHIEAGIAYGLGKNLILIGEPEKPESLYFIFNKRFDTIEEFLDTL